MRTKRLLLLVTAIALGLLVWGEPTYGASAPNASALQTLLLGRRLLAKATPDEDFNGVGEPYLPGPPFEHEPKVNQAYAWGMTKAGDKIWIGSGANTVCMLLGGYSGGTITQTIQTDSFVCEFAESQYDPTLPSGLEDWRPPVVHRYDLSTDTGADIAVPSPLLTSTLGLRSAGNHNGVVILGGPQFGTETEITGINLFAFDAESGDFLGAINMPQYANIRKWLVVDDVLYTTVGNIGEGGEVLRWRGNATSPFQFEVVATWTARGPKSNLTKGGSSSLRGPTRLRVSSPARSKPKST